MSFLNAGVANETTDRIYRALFVYSVGFHELLKKSLEHSSNRFTLVTNIWKVFSILLEYCCRTDYLQMISEVSVEHRL